MRARGGTVLAGCGTCAVCRHLRARRLVQGYSIALHSTGGRHVAGMVWCTPAALLCAHDQPTVACLTALTTTFVEAILFYRHPGVALQAWASRWPHPSQPAFAAPVPSIHCLSSVLLFRAGLGIPLATLDEQPKLDVAIDGADEASTGVVPPLCTWLLPKCPAAAAVAPSRSRHRCVCVG